MSNIIQLKFGLLLYFKLYLASFHSASAFKWKKKNIWPIFPPEKEIIYPSVRSLVVQKVCLHYHTPPVSHQVQTQNPLFFLGDSAIANLYSSLGLRGVLKRFHCISMIMVSKNLLRLLHLKRPHVASCLRTYSLACHWTTLTSLVPVTLGTKIWISKCLYDCYKAFSFLHFHSLMPEVLTSFNSSGQQDCIYYGDSTWQLSWP